jgi:hypothetical protein
MLVIMDRGFPGVALWKACIRARVHLLIRARSSVAARPVQVLADGTYLARMNLAGQKGAHPGGVLVRGDRVPRRWRRGHQAADRPDGYRGLPRRRAGCPLP